MTAPQLLTTTEVAERTGYSARTIVRWAESGRITAAHKLPGTGGLLFSEDELRKLPRKLEPESAA